MRRVVAAMLRLLLLLLVASTAGGQHRVLYEEAAQDDEEVTVVAEQPWVVVQAGPLLQKGLRMMEASSGVTRVVATSQGHTQGHRMFQFLIPPTREEVLSPSAQLPASCGPFIVSLEHATFRERAYHFSWCHRAEQRYTHQQAAAYCRTLAQHHPLQFEVLRLEDQEEADFISRSLQTHQIPSAWTGHHSGAARHSLQSYIFRAGGSQPDGNCLSVEAAGLARRRFWLQESDCLLHKAVICEADPLA